MGPADYIGGRGESLAFASLAQLCRDGMKEPYFWPHFLGEKWEVFDFLVRLVGAGDAMPYFFVQVKSTRKDLTKRQNPPRLRVEVSESDVRRMVAFPAPTYVIGVHEPEERAFVISVHGAMGKAIPSITTAHELTPDTLRQLWEEVREFWESRDMSRSTSSFVN